MRGLATLSPPAAEPAALTELKAQLRLETGDEDALLARLIAAARARAEAFTGLAFVARTLMLVCDVWPMGDVLKLPRPPLVSVGLVEVADEDGVFALWDASGWAFDTAHTPGRLVRRADRWPQPGLKRGGIRVTFEAGYGAPADVPAALVQAILIDAAHLFEHRGDMDLPLPGPARALLAPFRAVRP